MFAPVQKKPKKKPKAPEPAAGGVQFLTYSHPQDWSSKESRLAVRSHVTRRQHQLSRGEIPSPTSEGPSSSGNDVETGSGAILKFPNVGHRKRKSIIEVDTDPKRRASQTDNTLFSPIDDRFVLSSHSEGPTRVPSPWIPSEAHSSASSAYPSRSSSTSLIGTQAYRVGSVPAVPDASLFALPPDLLSDVAAREMLFASMEDYMIQVFAPTGFSSLFLTPDAGRLWTESILHHSKIEPTLRLVRLLFASGHLIQIGLLRSEVGVWLHERAVAELFTALASEKRKASEGLILATGRLAFYESMFGDRHMAHEVHRPAQRRMITSRGGMEALKLPEAVKYLMRWADIVMSLQSGSGSLLDEDSENDPIQTDSAEQSLRALAVWLPEQYAALRAQVDMRDQEKPSLMNRVDNIDPHMSPQ